MLPCLSSISGFLVLGCPPSRCPTLAQLGSRPHYIDLEQRALKTPLPMILLLLCVCIHWCRNAFTEPLPSDGRLFRLCYFTSSGVMSQYVRYLQLQATWALLDKNSNLWPFVHVCSILDQEINLISLLIYKFTSFSGLFGINSTRFVQLLVRAKECRVYDFYTDLVNFQTCKTFFSVHKNTFFFNNCMTNICIKMTSLSWNMWVPHRHLLSESCNY